ncbi:MAG: HAD family phosphatase [Acidimicrobiales bacterium]
MPPELVIFDNDGVLVDSEPLSNSVMATVLTELGVPTTVEGSMSRFLGRSLPAVRHIVETEDGITLPIDFEGSYTDRLHDLFTTSLTVVPGMRDVVEAVAGAGIAYCVASSGGHDKIRLTHALVGLTDLFADLTFSADDVAHGKPEPDLFLHAAASMAVDPAACIVIEDSPAGVEAARRAGMDCIGFAARTGTGALHAATLGVVTAADDIGPILGL